MNVEEKIDLINVYRKLLKHKLPVKTKDEKLRETITSEFRSWVESKIKILLGEDRPIVATNSDSPVVPVPRPQRSLVPAPRPRPGIPPQKLPESTEEVEDFNEDLASFLEKLDQQGESQE